MEQRQGFYGSRAIGLVCVGEAVGKMGEGDEMMKSVTSAAWNET